MNNQIRQKPARLLMALLATVLFLFSTVTVTATAPTPTDVFYVNDYAGVLSDETKQGIVNANVDLNEKTGAQVVVVVAEFLDGLSAEDYADKIIDSWKVGDATKQNGFVLVVSTGERKYASTWGKGMNDTFDSSIKNLEETYLLPGLRDSDYDKGVQAFFTAIIKKYDGFYGVTTTGLPEVAVTQTPGANGGVITTPSGGNSGTGIFGAMFGLIMAVIGLAIVIAIIASISSMGRRSRRGGGYYGAPYVGGYPRRRRPWYYGGGYYPPPYYGGGRYQSNNPNTPPPTGGAVPPVPPSGGGFFGGGSGWNTSGKNTGGGGSGGGHSSGGSFGSDKNNKGGGGLFGGGSGGFFGGGGGFSGGGGFGGGGGFSGGGGGGGGHSSGGSF